MKLRTAVGFLPLLTIALSPLRGQDTTVLARPSAPADTEYVDYHDPPVSLPYGIGLRAPNYDRVNGLALPWGPKLETGDGRVDVDGLVTYRSNLGKWDPSLEGILRAGDSQELTFYVGRGTFTNDTWIRSKLDNSVTVLLAGSDARNWYRADRATARFAGTITGTGVSVTPFIAGNLERDWSTGSLAPTKSPWSFYGRKDDLRMRRPNPPVYKGSISSILGGAGLLAVSGGLDARLDATIERSLRITQPDCLATPGGLFCPVLENFTQATLDGKATFPTFGSQTFMFKGHAIFTGGGALPQRFGYVGGSSTLPTVDLLALGGDHLLFLGGEYKIPFDQINLPYIGNPYLSLRYEAGNAGVDGIPTLIQNLGVSLGVSLLRIDYTLDPASNRSPFSRRSVFSASLSLSP